MMSGRVKVTLLRACLINGKRAEPGRLEVPPLVASDLIACGKAELVNADDAEALRQAVHAATLAAIRAAGKPWHQPEPGHGWQRIA